MEAAEAAGVDWRALGREGRSKAMLRLADLIERDLELFAQAESRDNGKPMHLARKVDIPRAIANLRFFATAILHFREIDQEERDLCEDLIFNRREDALQRFIQHFENVEISDNTVADPTEGMTSEQKFHWKIVHRFKDGVEADIDEIINRSLLPNPSPEGGRESPLPSGEGEGEGKPRKYNPRLPDELKERIRELRQNSTDAEKLMWQLLRNRAIHDAKFRRQHPIASYILDFYCHEAKLAIELDGSGHLEDKQAKYDDERTKILNEQGIRVLRFLNNDVLKDTESVLNEFWIALEEASVVMYSPHSVVTTSFRIDLQPPPTGSRQAEVEATRKPNFSSL